MNTALAIGAEPSSPTCVHRRYEQQLPLEFEPEITVVSGAPDSDIGMRARSFVQALIEVLAGNRSVLQMAQWTTPDVYEGLVRRLTIMMKINHTTPYRPHLASLHVYSPHPRAAEISARVVHGHRSRAIALRLDLLVDPRGRWRWRCTALSVG